MANIKKDSKEFQIGENKCRTVIFKLENCWFRMLYESNNRGNGSTILQRRLDARHWERVKLVSSKMFNNSDEALKFAIEEAEKNQINIEIKLGFGRHDDD